MTDMRESKIEKEVCDYAKKKGWLVYKFVSPSCKGVPDRIFLRDGVVFFIEFKATGEELEELQKLQRAKILDQRINVFAVDSIECGKGFIDMHDI